MLLAFAPCPILAVLCQRSVCSDERRSRVGGLPLHRSGCLAHGPLQGRQVLLRLSVALGDENGVVVEDVLLDSLDGSEVAGGEATDGVDVEEVKHADAEGATHVLKDLDRVGGRLVLDLVPLDEAVLVHLRVHVSHCRFRLVLPRGANHFGRQAIDVLAAGVVALERVAIGQPGQFANADATTAFPRQTVLLVLAVHHFVGKAALAEVEVEAVHGNESRQEHGL